MIRNVIFDWSGTLVDDLPAVLEATNHVMRKAGLPEMARDRFCEEFVLPFTGFYERHLPHVPMAQLEEWFHARFREAQDSVIALPHALDFLEFCRARGLRTALLSAAHPAHFEIQSKATGLRKYLDHVFAGVWDKRLKIQEILETLRFDPEETMFIGDMAHDVETARHGATRAVAVLTGYSSSAQLRAAGPDLLVEHLGELREALESNGMDLPGCGGVRDAARARAPVVTVGAAIFDGAGRVLMVRTHKWSRLWGIPGGKVKYGETCEDALRRELREETGLDVSEIRFALAQDCIRSEEFYREEHFVLLNYTCRTDSPEAVQLNEEAQEYRWVTLEEALRMDLNKPTRVLLEALR